MVCKRIRVFGKVQGVFYRASTKTMADDLKLVGWVRNEPDGTVMLEVQGEAEKVKKMIQWCKEGPTYSRVDDVLLEDTEPQPRTTFEIVY